MYYSYLGLVIQRAWYGVFEENEEYPKLSDVCFSVATQLQICVVNSKLILHQGQSKASHVHFRNRILDYNK